MSDHGFRDACPTGNNMTEDKLWRNLKGGIHVAVERSEEDEEGNEGLGDNYPIIGIHNKGNAKKRR